jgi:hypothetical protein
LADAFNSWLHEDENADSSENKNRHEKLAACANYMNVGEFIGYAVHIHLLEFRCFTEGLQKWHVP